MAKLRSLINFALNYFKRSYVLVDLHLICIKPCTLEQIQKQDNQPLRQKRVGDNAKARNVMKYIQAILM